MTFAGADSITDLSENGLTIVQYPMLTALFMQVLWIQMPTSYLGLGGPAVLGQGLKQQSRVAL